MPINCHPKNLGNSVTALVHSHEGVQVQGGWILFLLATWCPVRFVPFCLCALPKLNGASFHLNLISVQKAECMRLCSAHGGH